MTDDFSGILRRSYVAVATTTYADESLCSLAGVADEVKTLTDWLCNEALGDRRFAVTHSELSNNPSVTQVENALKRPEREWNDGDAAVVFVSGHGLRTGDGHWIAVHDTDTAKPRKTALGTSELIGWLRDTDIDHLLVIVDLCHSGAAGFDTVRMPDFPPTWLGLASASANQLASTGALTVAISGFLDELNSPVGERFDHGPYLRVRDFIDEVQNRLPGQRLHFLHTAVPDGGPSPCLPNPRHVAIPESVAPARRDLAIRAGDLAAHWEPKSRGSAIAWMFTGRATVMQRLIRFLKEPPAALVVTGGAGTGKSAVLGRLVTLTDHQFCATHADLVDAIPNGFRPGLGAVDVAVLATGKLSHEIFAQVLDVLGVPLGAGTTAPTLDELHQRWDSWLARQPGTITVVMDALDEAKNPAVMLDEIVKPLAGRPGKTKVRLIIGVRSPGGGGEAAPPIIAGQSLADRVVTVLGAERLAVDEEPWWHDQDLADYAIEILTSTPGSPYGAPEKHDIAGRVAGVLARHAQKSFLVTRLAATKLAADHHVVYSDDPSWLRSLDKGVLGVFRDDLHSALPNPDQRLRAVHLLRAVAFAYGRGLPWSQIWPLVANAVADRPGTYGDRDIADLLGSRLGGYLVRDHEDGITVYRLFHDALRTTLRERWRELLDPEQ